MPTVTFEVDGRVREQFVIRDGTRTAQLEPRSRRRRPRRDYLSKRQRQMLSHANEDVFEIIQRIEEYNQERTPGVTPTPCRLYWISDNNDDKDQFYKTSQVLRSALSGRCHVEVITKHGAWGWQFTFN